MARVVGVIVLLSALLGCSGGGEVRYATLTGELTWPEPIALPPGAQAHIALRLTGVASDPAGEPTMRTSFYDPREPGSAGGIIARDTVAITGPQPIPFTLHYNRDAVDPSRMLVIDAWITDGEQVLFTAATSPRVATGSAALNRITVRRPTHMAFACADGSRPSAAFSILGELAFLESDGGRPVALRAQPAASGFRYDGDGYSLRGKGREAVLRRPLGSDIHCQAAAP
jgi:uncharacterized lipoprotein YbaY